MLQRSGPSGIVEFGPIATAELGEPVRIVGIPAAQGSGWGDLLAPFVQVSLILGQAARPEAVDQHPGAVLGCAVVVDAADPYSGLLLHARASPVSSHPRLRADGGGGRRDSDTTALRRGRVHLVPTCLGRRQCGTDARPADFTPTTLPIPGRRTPVTSDQGGVSRHAWTGREPSTPRYSPVSPGIAADPPQGDSRSTGPVGFRTVDRAAPAIPADADAQVDRPDARSVNDARQLQATASSHW